MRSELKRRSVRSDVPRTRGVVSAEVHLSDISPQTQGGSSKAFVPLRNFFVVSGKNLFRHAIIKCKDQMLSLHTQGNETGRGLYGNAA